MPTAPTQAQVNITEDDDAGWAGSRTVIPPTSSESDGDEDVETSPPSLEEAASSDSEPVEEAPADETVDADGKPKKPETAEEKAEREKQEQIANRWKLVEKAKKEHLAVAKKQRDLTASTAKLEQERQQFALERQTHARAIQEAQNVLDVIARVRANPTIEGLGLLGFDYMKLTTEMVNANTPEAIAQAAREEARQLREERQREQRTFEANRIDGDRLVRHAEENEDLYPDLVSMSPDRIAQRGIELRDKHREEHGRYPTYQWVIEQLQEQAKARAAKRAGGATNSEAGTASANRDGHQANRPTGKPSIGNTAATTRASAPREMTEEEKDDWALSQLRGLRRAR